MRKSGFTFLSYLILVAICLSACNLIGESQEENVEEIAKTLMAVMFTQTAMAQISEPEVVTTETPMKEPPLETIGSHSVEETISASPIIHHVTPGNPGLINKWLYDTDSSFNASDRSVTGGDDFIANLYERPFTESDMTYRPDIDIKKAEISEDATFYYVTIYLHGTHPEGDMQAAYGVEIDEDRDGRGDLLIIADRPTATEWEISGLSVWKDTDKDIGGRRILRPDTDYLGNSYEQEIFSINVLDDPDAAWARVSTTNPPSVTIAFKKTLLSRNNFVWGVWAAETLLDPALFDHHDHYTLEESGSPYASHNAYPLKSLNLIDNTCRETYKFETSTPIPGLCYPYQEPQPTQPPPVPEPTLPEPIIPEPTMPEPLYGAISGVVFDDLNRNGVRDPGEPLTIYANPPSQITISLHIDSCETLTLNTRTTATFSFNILTPGTYCVRISGGTNTTTPDRYLINLAEGESREIEFGFDVVY